MRYAVTGGFSDNTDPAVRDYCYKSLQFYLSHDGDGIGPSGLVGSAAEDVAQNDVIGANDEAYDCEIPRSVTGGDDKTSALQNYARLRSIYDETLAGALVVQTQMTDTVSGTLMTHMGAGCWSTSTSVPARITARS